MMDLQVLGEVGDALGKNGDLYLGRTGVGLMQTVLFDDCGFLFFLQHCFLLLS